jgi:hypothetical protein
MKQHIPEKQNSNSFYIALLLMIAGLVLLHSFHISPETEKFVQILVVFAIYGLMWLSIQ